MIAQSTAPAVDSLSDRAKAELRAAIYSGSILFWRGFPDIPPLPGGLEALDDFDVCRYIAHLQMSRFHVQDSLMTIGATTTQQSFAHNRRARVETS